MLEIIVQTLYTILQIYVYIMFVYIILSWTPLINSAFYKALGRFVDPYLNIFRGKFIVGMFDLGSLIGIILLQVVLMMLGNLQ